MLCLLSLTRKNINGRDTEVGGFFSSWWTECREKEHGREQGRGGRAGEKALLEKGSLCELEDLTSVTTYRKSQAWWHTLAIPMLGRQRQTPHSHHMASLTYSVSPRPVREALS